MSECENFCRKRLGAVSVDLFCVFSVSFEIWFLLADHLLRVPVQFFVLTFESGFKCYVSAPRIESLNPDHSTVAYFQIPCHFEIRIVAVVLEWINRSFSLHGYIFSTLC